MKKGKCYLKLFAALCILCLVVACGILTTNVPAEAASFTLPTFTENIYHIPGYKTVTIGDRTYNYGVLYSYDDVPDGSVAEDFLITGTDLKYSVFGYGDGPTFGVWDWGIIIEPANTTGTNYTVPNEWTGYTDYTTKVQSIYLCEGVTGIGNKAFSNSYTANLQKVYLADSVTTIGAEAFKSRQYLESVDLSHVTTIGNSAFYGCGNSNFTTVNIATAGVNLVSIGNNAFSGCTNITSVNIGSGVSNESRGSIGTGAFYSDCDKITSVEIGSNLTVYNRAFASEAALKTFKCGDNVSFDIYVFYENTNLETVTMGSNITLSTGVFRACYRLKSSEGKDYLDLTGVKSIGAYCFEDDYLNLKEVRFSSVLTTIGERAFSECFALTTLNLGDTSVTTISKGAFAATGITSITIPATVKTIQDYAFSAYMYTGTYRFSNNITDRTYTGSGTAHRTITSLSFENGSALQSIGKYAFFRQGFNMSSLEIPGTVKTIGDHAFYCCGTIGDLTLLSNDEITIGYFTFASSNISSLTVYATNLFKCQSGYSFHDNSINTLDIKTTGTVDLASYTFYQHRNLQSEVIIKANTIKIGSYGFYISEGYKNTAAYQTLKKLTLLGTSINIGSYAFAYNRSLEELNMPNITQKSQLTLGTAHVFGHDAGDAFYKTGEHLSLTPVGSTEPQNIEINTGMKILLGNMDENGPLTKFSNGHNYYAGNNYTLVLSSTEYPTCMEVGHYIYHLTLTDGVNNNVFIYMVEIAALGHLYGDSVYTDADCEHSEYYEKTCTRGCVDHQYGVDADGYAIDENGARVTAPCSEDDCHVISEIDGTNKLNHEFYAGKLYRNTDAKIITPAIYQTLPADQKSNFVRRYSNDGGNTLISPVAYAELPETTDPEIAAKQAYILYYIGYEYLTVSEYNALSAGEQAEYTELDIGTVIEGEYSSEDQKYHVTGTDGTVFTAPFTGFNLYYYRYDCYRETHTGTVNNYSIAYIPITLTGVTDQTLADIDLGVSDLEWKDPTESLAGPEGVREFIALYSPAENGIDVFKKIEVVVKIDITRASISLEDVSFSGTKQSTEANKIAVQASGIPAGLNLDSTKYYDGASEILWEDLLTRTTALDASVGKVVLTYTYDNDVYDLISSGSGDTAVFWKDGVYNDEGAATTIDNIPDGYTVTVSKDQSSDEVTIVISHSFELKQPSLDIVEAVADSVIYDGQSHGFTLLNVPAQSTVVVKRWTTADVSGAEFTGTDAYSNTITLTDPEAGLTVYSDLRTVETYAAFIQNAGTYYYKVSITNASYETNGGTTYDLYVTVVIGKQPYNASSNAVVVYDGKQHTGFAESTIYEVLSGNNTGTNAGTYAVTLRIKDNNYKWEGYQDNATQEKEFSWSIRKREVAVPGFDSSKAILEYNSHYQTPLVFSTVDTVVDDTPAEGDYKYEITNSKNILVSIYLNGSWHTAYTLYGANKRAVGQYAITSVEQGNASGLASDQNYMWPGNAQTLALGSWKIVSVEVPKPTLVAPNIYYTGSQYGITPTLSGSWDMVNDDGTPIFDKTKQLVFKFYDASGVELSEAPTNVGLYSVKVDIAGCLLDTGYTNNDHLISQTFQINKALISLESPVDGDYDYTGNKQYITIPVLRDADGNEIVLDKDGNVTSSEYTLDSNNLITYGTNSIPLRFYTAVVTQKKQINPDTQQEETIYEYSLDANDTGSLVNYVAGNVGSYAYFVEIDADCVNYTSGGSVLVLFTIKEAYQTVTAEKDDSTAEPTVTADTVNETITVDGRLGTEPLKLYFRGEKDVLSALSFTYAGQTYTSGTFTAADGSATVKIEAAASGGYYVTIAFNAVSNSFSFVVNCTKTANIRENSSVTVNVVVSKALPTVEISKTLKGSNNKYTGSSIYNFAATVTGKNAISITNGLTPVAVSNPSDYVVLFFNTLEDAEAHTNALNAEPVLVGTYYAVAKYNGDSNYDMNYSDPLEFVIVNNQVTLSNNGAQTSYYTGTQKDLLPTIVVTGNSAALTRKDAATTTAGEYYIEYYPTKSSVQPDASAQEWSLTMPSVKNVADSGTYWYRIIAANYDTVYASVAMTVNRVDLTVSATGISLTKIYDGTKKLLNTSSKDSWSVAVSATENGCSAIVAAEIADATVTGFYPGGKNVQTNGNITVEYVINGVAESAFDSDNYTVRSTTIPDAKFTDATTYEGKGSITKKALSITGITAIARAYNGTNVVYLGGTLSAVGLVEGETVTLALVENASGTISSANASDTPYEVTVLASAVSMTGAASGNYSIADADVTNPSVTISKANSTIKFDNLASSKLSAIYTGNSLASTVYAVTVSGVTGYAPTRGTADAYITYTFSDSSATLPGAPTDAGTYYIVATYAGDTNYNGCATESTTIEISNAALTVVPTAYSAIYDGATHKPATFVITGLEQTINDATIKFKFAGTTDPEKTEAQIAELAGFDDIDVKNVSDSGYYYYEISKTNFDSRYGCVKVEITKKTVSISTDGYVNTKIYDRGTVATITGGTVTGAIDGETVSVTAATATYDDKTVGTDKTVTIVYTMGFSDGALVGNYNYIEGTTTKEFASGTSYTATYTTTGSITKLAISVTGMTATDRVYNGSKSIDLVSTNAALSGVIAGDTVTVKTWPSTGTVESENADTAAKSVSVTWSDTVLDGADGDNYEVTSGNAVTATISKADPSFTLPSILVVGFSNAPVETYYYYITVNSNDGTSILAKDGNSSISYKFYKDANHTVPAVGSDATVPPTNRNDAGSNLPYYVVVSYDASANGDINHNDRTENFELMIEATGFEKIKSNVTGYSKIYDGKSHAILTAAEIFSDLKTDGTNNDNITAQTKIYVKVKGQETTVETPSDSDFSDTNSGWKLVYDNGTAVSTNVSVKDVSETQYWVALYNVSHKTIVLTTPVTVQVTAATLTVSADVTTSKTYDALKTAATKNAAVTGIKENENITVSASSEYSDKAVGTGKQITTTYTLTFTNCSASNYVVTLAEGTLTAVEGSANTYTTTTTGSISVKEIAVTGATATNRIYNGTKTVALAGTLASADLCADDITAGSVTLGYITNPTGTLDTTNSDDKPGTYDVTIATSTITISGTDAGNYSVKSVNSPSVTIAKKQLEVKYGNKSSKTNPGETGSLTAVTYNTYALTGYDTAIIFDSISGGAATENVVYTFFKDSTCTTAAVGSDSSTAPTAAGTYYIKAAVADNDYYLGANVVAEITINKADLTVSAQGYSGVYDGTTHVPATFTVSGKGTDTTITSSQYTVKFYSDSDRTSEVTTVKNYSDSKTYYYTISYENYLDNKGSVSVSISRISVDVKSTVTSLTKVYDATTTVALTDGSVKIVTYGGSGTYDTLIQSELGITATSAYDNKNVGIGKTIKTTYSISLKGTALFENYIYNSATLTSSIETVASMAGIVTAKNITVKGAAPVNYIYNGSVNVTLDAATSNLTSDDICQGDVVDFAINATVNNGTAAKASLKDQGTRTVEVTANNVITLSNTDSGNYSVTKVECSDVTISRATPSFTWPSTMSVVYTGTNVLDTYYAVTVVGISATDYSAGAVTYTFNGSSVVPTNVGTYTVVATIAENGNYTTYTKECEVKLVINNSDALAATVTGYGTKVYDGSLHNAVVLSDIKGVNSTALDSANYTIYYALTPSATKPTEAFTNTQVWSNDPASIKHVSESGKYWYVVVAPNYSNLENYVEVTINKFEYDVSSTLTKTKVYDGTLTAAVSDAAFLTAQTGDTIGISAVAVYNSINASTSTFATKASKITTTYTVTFDASIDMNDYCYAHTVKSTNDHVVTIDVVTDNCTITKKEISIEIGDQNSTYDATEPSVGSVRNTNWTLTDGTIYLTDDESVTLSKESGKNVGSYVISGTMSNSNYTVNWTNGTFTIAPKEITVTIGDTNGTYGNSPVLPSTLLTTTDSLASTATELAKIRSDVGALTTDATSTSSVGSTYYIRVASPAQDGVYGNYKITFAGSFSDTVSGTYTVNKRDITIKANGKTKKYDVDLATLDSAISAGSLATGETYTVTMHTDATKTSNVGSYKIYIDSITIKNAQSTETTSNYNYVLVDSDDTTDCNYVIEKATLKFGFNRVSDIQSTTNNSTFTSYLVFKNVDSDRDMNAENGNAFNGTITYRSGDETMATVDSNGKVTTLKEGQVVIYAKIATTADCNYIIPSKDEISYTLVIGAAGAIRANVTAYKGTQVISDSATGAFANIDLVSVVITYPVDASSVTVEYKLGNDGTWSANVPQASGIGTYEIYIKATANQYDAFETVVTAEISALPNYTISFILNGGKITSAHTASVQIMSDCQVLAANVPEVAYTGRSFEGWLNPVSGSTLSSADVASTVVTGNITLIAQWTIIPLTVDDIDPEIYTGSDIRPAVNVYSEAAGQPVLLTVDEDYVVAYVKNVKVGTATVSIVGIGDYAGINTTKTFSIVKADQEGTFELGTEISVIQGRKITNILNLKFAETGIVVTYSINRMSVANLATIVFASGEVTANEALIGDLVVKATVTGNDNVNGAEYEYTLIVKTQNIVNETDPDKPDAEYVDGTITNPEGFAAGEKFILIKEDKTQQELEDEAKTIASKLGNLNNITPSDIAQIYDSYTKMQLYELVADKEVLAMFDIYIKDANNVIITQFNGIYTVRIKLTAELLKAKKLQIVYRNGDSIEIMESSIIGEYIVFTTSHFSTYLLIGLMTTDISDPANIFTPIEDQVYTGSEIKPGVIIKDGAYTLVEGTDYTVGYTDNTVVGTASITITGINSYVGTKTVTFNIVKAKVTIPTVEDKTYTGHLITSGLTDTALYTVVEDNGTIDVAACAVKIQLVDSANYKWSDDDETALKTINYNVGIATNAIPVLVIPDWTYGDSPIAPYSEQSFGVPVFTYYGYTFDGTYYPETSAVPTEAGSYEVVATITATANYTGVRLICAFEIKKAEQTITSSDVNVVYDGNVHSVTAITSGNGTISYVNNDQTTAGSYVVVVTAAETNNYKEAVLNVNLVINKKPVDVPSIASKVYTGAVLTADVTDTVRYTVTENEGGECVGNHTVVLTLTDSVNYKWTTTEDPDVVLSFAITKASNSINGLSIASWTYSSNPNEPIATANFGTIVFTYSGTAYDGTVYTNVSEAPKKAGSYTVTATVADTSDYAGATDTKAFTINKFVVPTPMVMSAIFDGTLKKGSCIGIHNMYDGIDVYTIVKNDGGIAVGSYDFNVKLTNKFNYTWQTTTSDTLELKFNIVGAGNAIHDLTITGWTYGDAPVLPTATADFGSIVYTYFGMANDGIQYLESTVAPTKAGSYTVRATVPATLDYAGASAMMNFTISKKSVEAPSVASKVYTGNILTADITGTALYTVTENNGGTAVGSYDVALRLVDFSNYKWSDRFTPFTTVKFNITIAPNAINNLKLDSWVYGFAPAMPTSTADFGSVVYTYFGTANDGTSYAESTDAPVKAGSYTVKATVTATADYEGAVATAYFTINKKTVEAPAVDSKVYTGNSLSADIVNTGNYTVTANAGGTDVGSYDVELTLVDENNYKWADSDVTTKIVIFKITKAVNVIHDLTITGWTYGDVPSYPMAAADFGKIEYTYFGTKASGDVYPETIFAPTAAGTYYVKATVYGTANYDAVVETTGFSIAKRTIVVPEFGFKFYTGSVLTADVFDTEEYIVVENEGGVHVGTYIVELALVAPDNYIWSNESSMNVNKSFEIKKAANAIHDLSIRNWVYIETASTPTATADFGDVVFTFFGTENSGKAYTESTVAPFKAGTYYVKASVAETADYYGAEDTTSFTISRAILTAPSIENLVFNGALQTAVVPESPFYTVVENEGGTTIGTYSVVLKLVNSFNFKWSTTEMDKVTLTYKIVKSANYIYDLSIVNWVYGDNASVPTATSTNGVIKYAYTGITFDGQAYLLSEEVPTQAGSYILIASVEGNENYDSATASVHFVISKKDIIIIPDSLNKIYGSADPEFTYEVIGLVDGDSEDIVTGNLARIAGENVGEYDITIGTIKAGNNYNVIVDDATLTIAKATLYVDAIGKSITYGDQLPEFEAEITGFMFNDSVASLGGELQFVCDYVQYANTGLYQVEPYGYTSDNYTFVYGESTLAVGKASASIGITAANISVLSNNVQVMKAAVTGSFTGVKDSDEISAKLYINGIEAEAYTLYAADNDANEIAIGEEGTVTFKFVFEGNDNYMPAESATVEVQFTELEYTFSTGDTNVVSGVTRGTKSVYFKKEIKDAIPASEIEFAVSEFVGTGYSVTVDGTQFFVIILGDTNGDGFIDARDIAPIQKQILEIEDMEGIFLKAAEVNGDGVINSRDIAAIQRIILG